MASLIGATRAEGDDLRLAVVAAAMDCSMLANAAGLALTVASTFDGMCVLGKSPKHE